MLMPSRRPSIVGCTSRWCLRPPDALRICPEILLIVHGNPFCQKQCRSKPCPRNACAMLLEILYFCHVLQVHGSQTQNLGPLHVAKLASDDTWIASVDVRRPKRQNCAPFSLEPMGSPPLLMRTQALSSNLTTLPSGLWYFFAVRTTTACLISPRRTLLAALMDTLPPGPDSGPKLRCFCTTTMMRSPEQ